MFCARSEPEIVLLLLQIKTESIFGLIEETMDLSHILLAVCE
jgi:hypothetical protein